MKRRQKINKYEQRPEEEIDFHDMYFDNLSQVEQFAHKKIKESKAKNMRFIRFIVGKGIHSKNGPVIKPLIIRLLDALETRGEIRSHKFDSAYGTGQNTGSILIKL